MEKIEGYKAFDENLCCRGFQFEIGKEFKFDGEPIPCKQGFHFCMKLGECYNYYPPEPNTRICKVEALGEVKTDDEIKYCTNHIKILEEVKDPREESNSGDMNSGYRNSGYGNSGDRNSGDMNSGDRNSGDRNSGDRNSGDRNSGYRNSGYRNSGDMNSGYRNSGDMNSGYRNSGDMNSGDMNSGDMNSGDMNSGYRNSGDMNSGDMNSGYRNSGDRNSGDWNSGDWNSGNFCTEKNPKIKMFDKNSDWTMDDWNSSMARRIMERCPYTHTDFIWADDMSDDEKEKHPEHETIGGYIKTSVVTDKDKKKWWDNLSSEDKQEIYNLPNFDAEKFKSCTGIDCTE